MQKHELVAVPSECRDQPTLGRERSIDTDRMPAPLISDDDIGIQEATKPREVTATQRNVSTL